MKSMAVICEQKIPVVINCKQLVQLELISDDFW